jgi:hypothetical protein
MAVKQSSGTRDLYRNLALRLRNLLVKPNEEWQIINGESTTLNDMLSGFSLPLIGLATLLTFISFLVNQQALIFELALKQALLIFTALFGGLLLSFYMISKFLKVSRTPDFKETAAKLVVYSSAPLYVVLIIGTLVPEIFFIHILSVYSFYLCWVGIQYLTSLKGDKKMIFSFLLGSSVLLIPFLIRLLLLNLLSI